MSYEFDLLNYLVRTDHREAYPATFKIICTGISGISLIAYLISGLLNEYFLQVNAISVVFDFLIQIVVIALKIYASVINKQPTKVFMVSYILNVIFIIGWCYLVCIAELE